MTAHELRHLCNHCIVIAGNAGAEIMKLYNSNYEVHLKSDNTPVTDADILSHKIINTELEKFTPDIPVLSEENTIPPYSERKRWDTYWLIDPIDGSREFIDATGEFSVNIALIHKHKSVLGVIYAPTQKLCYFATLKGGAFKMDSSSPEKSIHVRNADSHNLTVIASRAHKSPLFHAYIKNLGDVKISRKGSSLKFCLIAEGKADIYPRFGPTSEWDTAAAQCILEEAGGQVTAIDMSPLIYNKKESILNPHFFAFGDRNIDWSDYLGLQSTDRD